MMKITDFITFVYRNYGTILINQLTWNSSFSF